MAQVVQAACPGCKGVLRIPADWVSQPIRCKSCGTVMQAKMPAAPPRAADKTPPPKPRKSASPPPLPQKKSSGKPASAPMKAFAPSSKPPSPAAKAPPAPVKAAALAAAPVARWVPDAEIARLQTAPSPLVGKTVSSAPVPTVAFDFDEPLDDSSAAPHEPRRRKRRGNGWIGLVVFGCVAFLAVGVACAFLPKIKAIIEQASADEQSEPEDGRVAIAYVPPSKPSSNPGTRPQVKTPTPKKAPILRPPADDNPPRRDPPIKNPSIKSPTPKPPGPRPRPMPRPRDPEDNPPPKPAPVVGLFPRRALIIDVHNYLYLNPITEGGIGSVNSARLIRSLNNGLHIPLTQIYQLSDSHQAKNPRPPLKSVIEKGLESFLKTTRKQDHILIFFIGHTKEIDNEGYLVPLEGEMDDKESLIPLKWVYDQMAKCDARQKVLVLDGNRNNPAQGEERPKSGPLGEKFQAMLKAPPASVQVWSACSAGQESNEFDDAPLGVFLDSLRVSLVPEKGKGALEGKIQKPEDPIPLAVLNEAINIRMQTELDKRKLKQVALLSGTAAGGAPYNRDEAPAAAPVFPEVNPASQAVVKEIMNEIGLPPLKGGKDAKSDVDFSSLPPFSPDALKEYDASMKPDEKFRQAIHEARVALWAVSTAAVPPELQADVQALREKLKVDLSIMKDGYKKPGAGRAETQFKEGVFNDSKRMSRIVAQLEDVLEKLKEAGAEKDKAPKRWQANYTFIFARFQAQLAYLEDYQSLLGQMRKEFPPHDPAIHNGWRMAAKEKAGDSMGKKYDKAARKYYAEASTAFKGTPWAVLAKREKLTALGLEWQPN